VPRVLERHLARIKHGPHQSISIQIFNLDKEQQ